MNRLNQDQELACLRPCDMTLVAKDGSQFQVHRNVLLQASPFFEKLLSSDMKESNEGVIRLATITDSQMADILKFIYNGSVQFTSQENAEKLIETADFLLLSNLKTMAGEFLEQHMTTETCISMNYLAERYSCQELVVSTRKFINSNFTTVAASKEFLSLPSYEVEKWISSDEIVIDAEENVFEIILRWIAHDKSERSGIFSELFTHVRLTCVSRDYLLSHVVSNDLVKENTDCLDSVTGALEWLDRPTDSRPHLPRKALTINVIVISDSYGELQRCIYLPAADEWYRFPLTESQFRLGGDMFFATVSCGGKVFSFNNRTGSACYDPDSNHWSPLSWTINLSLSKTEPKALVVKNKICLFINEEFPSIALWIYSVDSNLLTRLSNWTDRDCFCAVAVDSYIYVLGGTFSRPWWSRHEALSECTRFNTEKNEWQKITPLNEARLKAFGVCKNEKIFIAGGLWSTTCEVYSILTNEWQFIASSARMVESMVLVDETLYVLTREGDQLGHKVECYNHENNEWNMKATVPVNKLSNMVPLFLKCCSLRVFKGVLNNLESLDESD